jgi:hypothetical protein
MEHNGFEKNLMVFWTLSMYHNFFDRHNLKRMQKAMIRNTAHGLLVLVFML